MGFGIAQPVLVLVELVFSVELFFRLGIKCSSWPGRKVQ